MTALYPQAGYDRTAAVEERLARIESQLEVLLADARRRDRELEPLRDLAAEVGVIAGPAMQTVTDRVAWLDERGYLRFARSSAGVLDRVVTAFDEDDVEALGDNIVLILETLKGLTQPEIMHLLQRTASVAQQQAHEPPTGPPPSTLRLLRRLRDPEVRRGLGRVLDLLGNVGVEADPANPPRPPVETNPTDPTRSDHQETQDAGRDHPRT